MHRTPATVNIPADLIAVYWRHVAPRERAEAAARALRALDSAPGEFRCASCSSTRVHRDVIGDLVCAVCAARWRPPTSADSPTCPECGSGKVHKTGYGDWFCRACTRQWRPEQAPTPNQEHLRLALRAAAGSGLPDFTPEAPAR